MKYIYKNCPDSEHVKLELKRRSNDHFKMIDQSGISDDYIEQLRFEEMYKLNYPCNHFNQIFIEVSKVILNNSDKIHKDILFMMIKELTEIDIDEMVSEQSDVSLVDELYGKRVLTAIIENMENLYYFQDDEIFRTLIFQICNILDLDLEDYGFAKIA